MIRASFLFLCLSALLGLSTLSGADAAAQPPDCAPPPALAPCKTCHTLTPDKPSARTGSNLSWVFEASAAARDDFTYSRSMLEAKDKGLIWTTENLERYLADPARFLTEFNGSKGINKMLYQVRNEEMRQKVIEGLRTMALCR